MDLVSITKKFPTELSAIEFFEKARWKNKKVCPYCKSAKIGRRNKDYRFHCKKCKRSFSVKTKSFLHNTRLPLKTWLYAFALITDAKKGISAKQIERNLGISYDTAWNMGMKIRKLMAAEPIKKMKGITEMDETFVGGKPRWGADPYAMSTKKRVDLDKRLKELKAKGIVIEKGKSKPKKPAINVKRGRGTKKIPVVGIAQRDGDVVAMVMQSLTFKNLKKMVQEHVEKEKSVVITDEYKGYNQLDTVIEHIKIDHNKRLYSYKGVNTNTIESFWAIVKRGIMGQYHKVSLKYLPEYITEFVFKYNNRNEDDMFETLVNNAVKNISTN